MRENKTCKPNAYPMTGLKVKQPATKAAGDKQKQTDLAGGMGNLSVAEKVNVKSKNLDVLSEYEKSTRKKSANFVVIGWFFFFFFFCLWSPGIL